MAFNTYATLRPTLERITGLNDLISSGMADDAIEYFESWINRNIRHRSMLTSSTSLVLDAGAITHPSDWLEWESLENSGSPRHIEIVAGRSIADIDDLLLTGNAIYAVPRATATELYPAPSSITGLRGTYYAKLAPIITNSTNWLLTNHPDIYLNACVLAITMWKRDNEEFAKYAIPFEQVTGELVKSGERSTYGGSTLTVRSSR
jgi:hypothetical protein